MRFKNILIIGSNKDDALKLSKDVWELKKYWCIISTDDCYNYDVKQYIKNNPTIIISDGKCFEKSKVNSFINYCNKYNIAPFFITKELSDFSHLMYSNIEEALENSAEFIYKKLEGDEYNNFIKFIINTVW